MKKLLYLACILIFLSSCSGYKNLGGGGCGHWVPNKFEKGRKLVTRDHPMYRMGKGW